MTLISLDQIPTYLRQVKPARVDPLAMAAAAGVTLSRATSRALGKKGTNATSVQHQGRVTPKKSRG